MAIKGLSKPIVAEYKATGDTVTYEEPYAADCAVEYSVKVNTGDSKDLYADNGVKESSKSTFSSGDLTLKTADMGPKLSSKILGLKTATRQVGEDTVTEVIYDDQQNTTYKGFGIIEEHENDGVTGYLPVVFPRVRFDIPADAATTRGESIDWQTKEISGTILRSAKNDEKYKHPWKISPEEPMTTEADAVKYILAVFGSKSTSLQTQGTIETGKAVK